MAMKIKVTDHDVETRARCVLDEALDIDMSLWSTVLGRLVHIVDTVDGNLPLLSLKKKRRRHILIGTIMISHIPMVSGDGAMNKKEDSAVFDRFWLARSLRRLVFVAFAAPSIVIIGVVGWDNWPGWVHRELIIHTGSPNGSRLRITPANDVGRATISALSLM